MEFCTHRQEEWERLGQIHAATFAGRVADLAAFRNAQAQCPDCQEETQLKEGHAAYQRRRREKLRQRRKG